ncbi:MAG: ParB/RepB/Spo0J family partition protein [Bacteroidales bacterium]|nr:ParB/RepB/Spo0J family partition protein [Bacteroidales bacterium]
MSSALKLFFVLVAQCIYPSQPRTKRDKDRNLSLGLNMKEHGQKVPVLGYWKGDQFVLCDGGSRLDGAQQVGMTELLAVDLGKEPSAKELLLVQANIDQHRQNLSALDRARLWSRMCQEFGCTAKKLAEMLHVSEAVISRALALLQLPDDIQQQIHDGTLDERRGYLLTQESDPVRQRELAVEATALSRDELAKRVRKPKQVDTPQARMKRIVCPLPSGISITVSGADLSLDDFIEALSEAQKEARKAREQSLDAKTFAAVARDKAKQGGGR